MFLREFHEGFEGALRLDAMTSGGDVRTRLLQGLRAVGVRIWDLRFRVKLEGAASLFSYRADQSQCALNQIKA